MARLVHATSGVVVEVADDKVERLGSEWSAEKKTTSRSSKTESK